MTRRLINVLDSAPIMNYYDGLPLPELPPSKYPHYRFSPNDMHAFAKAAQSIALELAAKIVEAEAFPSERARFGVAADSIRALIHAKDNNP